MYLRKLYEMPTQEGLYFCLDAYGYVRIAKFYESKWYPQFGDGTEFTLTDEEVDYFEQNVMWIDGLKPPMMQKELL